MYSNRGIKPVSLGAAFIVNGALIAALYFFISPDIGAIIKDHVLTGTMIEEPPPPPPVKEVPPETKQVAREHPIVTPEPMIKTETPPNDIRTVTKAPEGPPPVELGTAKGTDPVTYDPPPPLPPLIAAQIDPRYAGSFQPEYPTVEIRQERDGKVSVRVLIGTDGRVKAVEDAGSTSSAFFEATKRQALSRWRFKPASRGGTPQESWKVMNVRFEMKNNQ